MSSPQQVRSRKKGTEVAKPEEKSEMAEQDDKKLIGSHVHEQFEMQPFMVLPLILALLVLLFGVVVTVYEINVDKFVDELGQTIRGYIDNFMPKNRYQK